MCGRALSMSVYKSKDTWLGAVTVLAYKPEVGTTSVKDCHVNSLTGPIADVFISTQATGFVSILPTRVYVCIYIFSSLSHTSSHICIRPSHTHSPLGPSVFASLPIQCMYVHDRWSFVFLWAYTKLRIQCFEKRNVFVRLIFRLMCFILIIWTFLDFFNKNLSLNSARK